jgi:hypothetical protein
MPLPHDDSSTGARRGKSGIRTPKKAQKTLGFSGRNVSQSGCFGTVCPTWGKVYKRRRKQYKRFVVEVLHDESACVATRSTNGVGWFHEVSIMAEKNFQVSLPPEVVGAFGWNDSEVPQRVREALVMDLLRLDRLSEAQAAAILRLARWELLAGNSLS